MHETFHETWKKQRTHLDWSAWQHDWKIWKIWSIWVHFGRNLKRKEFRKKYFCVCHNFFENVSILSIVIGNAFSLGFHFRWISSFQCRHNSEFHFKSYFPFTFLNSAFLIWKQIFRIKSDESCSIILIIDTMNLKQSFWIVYSEINKHFFFVSNSINEIIFVPNIQKRSKRA